MSQYTYHARDAQGQTTQGTIAAGSAAEAARLLSQRGCAPIQIAPARASADSSGVLDIPLLRKRVSHRELMWFMAQLSTMMQAQININEALQCLSRQNVSEQMKHVIGDIAGHVHDGNGLADALQRHPRVFSAATVSLIRAGELSGTLTFTLERISQYIFMEHRLRSQARGALIYPAIMFTVCLAVTITLLLTLVPRFEDIFESRGHALPVPTQMLLMMSNALTVHWPICLAVVIASAVGFWLWRASAFGRRQYDRLILALPVVGPILGKLEQYRAYQTLATMIEAGVPLLDTLQMTRQGSRNVHFQDLWQRVADNVRDGRPLAEPLLDSPLIDEPIAQMIQAGDQSGQIAVAFKRISAVLENEYQTAMRTATQMLEPTMIIVIGSIVGFIAIALLLPMLGAANVISG